MGAGRDHAPVPQHGVPRTLHARMGLCPLLSGFWAHWWPARGKVPVSPAVWVVPSTPGLNSN